MKEKYRKFWWFTVLPFLIPFISDLKDEWICPKLKWVIIIGTIAIDFYFSFITLKKEEDAQKELFVQKAVRYAYSYAHELMEYKRDTLSHDLEFGKVDLKNNILPYDIHMRIIDICRQFKNAISSITQINSEYVTCTLIYRYSSYPGASDEDTLWRWAGGRDPLDKLDLNEFVKEPDTSYYHIINRMTNFVYIPRKDEICRSATKMYHLGNRDKMYNDKGSAFSIKIAFGNNTSPLVEGILTVSTYGKYFTEEMDLHDADNVFQRMLLDEIFPYYKKLLETEFGMLYLRHTYKEKTDKE